MSREGELSCSPVYLAAGPPNGGKSTARTDDGSGITPILLTRFERRNGNRSYIYHHTMRFFSKYSDVQAQQFVALPFVRR